MLEGENYLRYHGAEDLIKEYYDALFFFKQPKVVDVLKGYCKLKGNAINDYMSCHFATEFSNKNDEEYFGENGVVFYLDYPAVDKDCAIVLSYDEFLEVVKCRYKEYISVNPEKKDEIIQLLDILEQKLGHICDKAI